MAERSRRKQDGSGQLQGAIAQAGPIQDTTPATPQDAGGGYVNLAHRYGLTDGVSQAARRFHKSWFLAGSSDQLGGRDLPDADMIHEAMTVDPETDAGHSRRALKDIVPEDAAFNAAEALRIALTSAMWVYPPEDREKLWPRIAADIASIAADGHTRGRAQAQQVDTARREIPDAVAAVEKAAEEYERAVQHLAERLHTAGDRLGASKLRADLDQTKETIAGMSRSASKLAQQV